jgi:cytochrome bd-type quinol oxidase subunit 2
MINKRPLFYISIFFVLFVVFFQGFFIPAKAASFEDSTGLKNTGEKVGYTDLTRTPADFYGILIKAFLGFLGVIFLLLMIYAGYTWMMARGNEAEVDKAKKMIESAIIGLVVVLAAYAITLFAGAAFDIV